MNETRGLWRGKRVDNGEWVEGYLRKAIDFYGKVQYSIITELNEHFIVDPSTLGECTGIPDKNEKLIFEGDMCTVATSNIADDEYGVVRFDENEAVFVIDFGTYTINFCNNVNGSAVEVIGNIHDNPRL